MDGLPQILEFLKRVNSMKYEIRYADVAPGKDDKRDVVAAHSWRQTLMVYLIGQYFIKTEQIKLDLDRAVKLAIIHDLPQAVVGNTSFGGKYKDRENIERKVSAGEAEGLKKLLVGLPDDFASEIYDLWVEYDNAETPEARFVKIMDKVEAALQLMEIMDSEPEGFNFEPAVRHSDKGLGWFPATDKLIALVREELKKYSEKYGYEWKPDYEIKV